jgi:putative acetyltransferase
VLIQARDALDPDLAALVAIQQRELAGVSAASSSPGAGQDLRFLVAVVDGRVVACVTWCPGEAGTAEIVGTYVRPAYRGRGITRDLLVALEEYAPIR